MLQKTHLCHMDKILFSFLIWKKNQLNSNRHVEICLWRFTWIWAVHSSSCKFTCAWIRSFLETFLIMMHVTLIPENFKNKSIHPKHPSTSTYPFMSTNAHRATNITVHIMYANVTVSLTLVSNKLSRPTLIFLDFVKEIIRITRPVNFY